MHAYIYEQFVLINTIFRFIDNINIYNYKYMKSSFPKRDKRQISFSWKLLKWIYSVLEKSSSYIHMFIFLKYIDICVFIYIYILFIHSIHIYYVNTNFYLVCAINRKKYNLWKIYFSGHFHMTQIFLRSFTHFMPLNKYCIILNKKSVSHINKKDLKQ